MTPLQYECLKGHSEFVQGLQTSLSPTMITIRQQNNIKKTIACNKCSLNLNFAVIVKNMHKLSTKLSFFLWKGLGTDTVKIESYLCQEEEPQ